MKLATAMPDLHLVDATYELFRAFYAKGPKRHAPDGTNVTGVRGLLGSMLRLLRESRVTHIGCATDQVIESWRNDLFAGYKTGEGMDPELYAQFPLAEEGLRALGLTVWSMVEFEADDAIGSAVHRYRAAFDRVLLCSPDKDFAQLVDDRVLLVDRMRGKELDPAGVREKFGVEPASIPDWLALVGDAADGLPGVPGWGAKSTAAVLSEYGHLDAIPEDPTTWTVKVRGAARLAENLTRAKDAALLYRRLATLRTDAPVGDDPESLRWRGPDEAALRAFAARIGDERLPERALGTWEAIRVR
jgi:5'-3' exonuclease